MKTTISVLYRFKVYFVLTLFNICVTGSRLVNAQEPIKRYVCPDATSSTFTYDEITADDSDDYCDSGTKLLLTVSGDEGIAEPPTVTRIDHGDSFHTAQVDVTWKSDQTGVLLIQVDYIKRIYKGFPSRKCKWTGSRYMYTYEIHREYISPGGEIAGTDVATASGDETESTFNLSYLPTSEAYLTSSGWVATKIRYLNGRDAEQEEVSITKTEYGYLPAPVTYHAKGKGEFILKSEVWAELDGQCGKWYPLPEKTLHVYSSCYQDDVSNVIISISPVGTDIAKFFPEDGSYRVKTGVNFTLNVQGITDFSSHFTWQANGGDDLTLNGDNFTVHETTGSYRIEAIPNDQGCPLPKPLQIFTGGENNIVDEDCSIVVPDFFTKEPYNLPVDDIIFTHFATYLHSDRSIVVMPGVTLDYGAELSIDVTPETESSDLAMNFTQEKTFDEYGRILTESRSYFDERGMPLQVQYKNIADQVILANATLYDAYGRSVISTLPAPVLADPSKACPIDDQDGAGMLFSYKENFIRSANGENYDYTHFDLANELSPVAVEASTEGTLGWYYSAANGNATTSKMHEPLVAMTQYPYSRTLFHHDGSGGILSVTQPGDAFKAGSAYLATMDMEPVSPDDIYFNTSFNSYLSIREKDLGLQRPVSIEGEFFKTISVDGSGKKTVLYTDKSGNEIITVYFGNGNSPIARSYQFFDNAGRLLASISPNGLEQYTVDQNDVSNFYAIDKTRYFYNSKGLLAAMEEKIAGKETDGISRTEYIYRKDGNIRFSQNEAQRNATPKSYSYTNYDAAGRPVESGEFEIGTGGITFNSTGMKAILESTVVNGGIPEESGTKKDRTFTYYDEPVSNLPQGRVQRFVQGAVSYTKKDNVITTWYSYDERGRVEWMVQDIAGFGVKMLDYRYGPTGQVQEVIYQRGISNEQFSHFYEYDLSGRLYKVFTTRALLVYDKLGKLTNSGITYNSRGQIDKPGVLEHQATYFYYLHGPLKRVELATRKEGEVIKTLQGIDYVYNVNGALKSINHADPSKDPGEDGSTPSVRADVFGMTLDYYSNDYVGAKNGAEPITISEDYADQYTGLIKAMRWHSPITPGKQFGYAYQYDQRNQFTKADWGVVTKISGAPTFTADPLKPYYEAISGYDANGNINGLQRNANILEQVSSFDYNLTYNYKLNTNMLQSISQTQGQNTTTFRAYVHDDLGRMTEETEGEKTKFVAYDVTGKVTGVYVDAAHTQPVATFIYDDRGFRLGKTSYNETFQPSLLTWYVRDASGNLVSTYEKVYGIDPDVRPVEMPVYGSGRIGLYKPVYGITLYELTDHLGNVRAVIGKPINEEYLATMETERNAIETEDFEKITPSATSEDINHTPAQVVVDSETYDIENTNEVLRMNNRPNGELHPDPIGTGIMLWVHPGDVINAEVFVKYANFNASDHNLIGGLSSFLYTAFQNSAGGVDISSIFNVVETPAVTGLDVWAKLDDTQPKAFLNYLLFDNDFNLQSNGFDFDQVSSAAEITGVPAPHERLSLDNITIEKEGFIYIYVSNESDQNMDVYFDDLRVKHNYSDIVGGGDFYPYGLAINDRQVNRDGYRFGYQGQFAEKDEETGWNHFELREYDPVIGRWTATDPARQYWSPYIGMGNNPSNVVDPDGAYSWLQAWLRSGLGLRGHVYEDGGEYGFNTLDSDGGIVPHFGDEMKPLVIDFSQNEVLNRLHEKQWSRDPFYRAKFGGDGIRPDYTIESFVTGGRLLKGGIQGLNWAGQRLLFGTSNRVFWSGGLAGSAGEAAGTYAAANGAITLEMTLTGKALTSLTNMTSYSTTKPLWRLASKGFANGAEGTAHVFINPTRLSSSSIWLNSERGILMERGVQYQYHIIPH